MSGQARKVMDQLSTSPRRIQERASYGEDESAQDIMRRAAEEASRDIKRVFEQKDNKNK